MDEKELKEKRLNHKHTTIKDTSDGWHNDICWSIIKSYFLVMAVIYPLYAPGGYILMVETKYGLFRIVSLIMLTAIAVVFLISAITRRDCESVIGNFRRMSVTDWFACGYFVMVIVSYLCSDYKGDALWGVEGWYMGVVTQVIFILTYFLFSRYFRFDLKWIGVWLLAGAAVFLLGICNRYSIYLFDMAGRRVTFISTLGNINWFCGYWSVTASIGFTLYWCSDRMRVRVAAGIYSMIAMVSGVTQGSESAYVVFAAGVFILFVLSFGRKKRMYRFLELCMMFAGGCILAKLLMHVPGLEINYIENDGGASLGFTRNLLLGNVAMWILFITLGCYILLRVAERFGLLQMINRTKNRKYFLRGGVAFIVTAACIAAIILLVKSGLFHTAEPSDVATDDVYKEIFTESWGTDRGFLWNCGINAYQDMDILHKIVGIGPDCFTDYLYSIPELAVRMKNKFDNHRVTNAHNEQLTLLVNVGALGWLCYAGMFVTAFVRYMRRANLQPMLYVCAVSLLAYTAHNMVSFQQVMNAPYVFIVLGIGESLYRRVRQNDLHPPLL